MGRVGANQFTVMDGDEPAGQVALKSSEHALEGMDVLAQQGGLIGVPDRGGHEFGSCWR
jgi:hypothetical protein